MNPLLSLPKLELDSLHRRVNEDAECYRARIYAHLNREFEEIISCVMSILHSYDLEFVEMKQVHAIELRRALIERHCLPYLLTHRALFGEEPVDCRILSACVAGHTLALTQLDYHLDGAAPSPANEATAVPVPVASAVSYAVRMIYAAGSIASNSGKVGRLFSEAFDPISGFVISRMHADWVSRFNIEDLQAEPSLSLKRYLEEPSSRLNGSGYWELMVRAAYIANSQREVPQNLVVYAQSLRRLRQIVDETADIEEDLRSGLITLPTLLAMARDKEDRVRNCIRSAWLDQAYQGRENILSDARSEILSNDTGHELEMLCGETASRAITSARNVAGPTSAALEVLVWLKLAKFEVLAKDRFRYAASVSDQRSFQAVSNLLADAI